MSASLSSVRFISYKWQNSGHFSRSCKSIFAYRIGCSQMKQYLYIYFTSRSVTYDISDKWFCADLKNYPGTFRLCWWPTADLEWEALWDACWSAGENISIRNDYFNYTAFLFVLPDITDWPFLLESVFLLLGSVAVEP